MELDKVLGNLKEKAGPLPEWVWIVGIAGLGYVVYKRKAKTKPTSTTNSTGSSTSIDPLTGIPYNQEGNGYTGAILAAQYDNLNALGMNTSQLGILNSGGGIVTPPNNGTPGIQYGSANTGKFVYDLASATYGQVQNDGGVYWLNNTQAAVLGANQKNSSPITDAHRVAGTPGALYTPGNTATSASVTNAPVVSSSKAV